MTQLPSKKTTHEPYVFLILLNCAFLEFQNSNNLNMMHQEFLNVCKFIIHTVIIYIMNINSVKYEVLRKTLLFKIIYILHRLKFQ